MYVEEYPLSRELLTIELLGNEALERSSGTALRLWANVSPLGGGTRPKRGVETVGTR